MIAAIADLAGADSILTDNESDFQHYTEAISPEIVSLRSLPQPEQTDLRLHLGLQEFLNNADDT